MRSTKTSFLMLQSGLLLLALFWALLATPLSASAQMVPSSEPAPAAIEIPENLTQEQIHELMARLSDDQIREIMISQLEKLAAEQDQTGDSVTFISQLSFGLDVVRNTLLGAFQGDNEISLLPTSIWQQMTGHGQISGGYLLFQLIGLLAVGWFARLGTRRLLLKTSAKPMEVLSLGKRFDLACYGIFTGILELAAFAVGAYLFIKIIGQDTPMAQIFWYQLIWCLVLIKLVMLAVRQVVSTHSPGTCLVSTPVTVARQVLGWTLILTTFLILPRPLVNLVADFGASPETVLLIRLFFSALFMSGLIVLAIRLRHYGAEMIAGKDSGSGTIRRAFARNWWLLAVVYLVLVWLMAIGKRAATGESSLVPGLGSIFLFVLIPYFDMALRWLITRYFEDKDDEEEAPSADSAADEEITSTEAVDEGAGEAIPSFATIVEPADSEVIDKVTPSEERAPVYIATALRYARVLMVVLILGIFMRLWDIDMRAISAQALGQRFSSALFDISITVLLTWALWGVIRISIERKLDTGKPAGEEEGETEAGGLGGTRVETVLPLIKVFIKITLMVMAVLISLSALGVNIGPLIAGAGVVGIAIGFGAQTLVRDIVSGFFYLIDDAFRIGEYVVIDQIRGTVEKISIRSFQLRHHNGPVHTIPYGEIRTLTNWSRDWSIMKFELRIAFETDIDEVRKIIKQIGIDIYEDPQFGPLMLAPMKSQGVNRMDDSALIIRCKFTSVPGQQFLIRREAFTRIQRVFEEKGIHFAPRRVVVEATTPAAAANAAAAAMDQEIEGKNQPKSSDL